MCTLRALAYETGLNGHRDTAQAYNQLWHACSGGDMDGCAHLGRFHEHGIAVGMDVMRALTLFRWACSGDVNGHQSPIGCAGLESLYYQGIADASDLNKSRRFFEVHCEESQNRLHYRCNELGRLYAKVAELKR